MAPVDVEVTVWSGTELVNSRDRVVRQCGKGKGGETDTPTGRERQTLRDLGKTV